LKSPSCGSETFEMAQRGIGAVIVAGDGRLSSHFWILRDGGTEGASCFLAIYVPGSVGVGRSHSKFAQIGRSDGGNR
jgi:hypothetical protein